MKEHEDGYLSIEYLYGISASEDEGILQTIYLRQEWELPDHIILLNSDGHESIFLDYRLSKSKPSVTFIDLEQEIEYKLADNFEEFMAKLEHSSDGNDEESLEVENQYTVAEFEEAVVTGEDAFVITDGFFYFAEIGADIDWFIKQGMIVTDNEDEFIVQESLGYVLRAVSQRKGELDQNLVNQLISKIKGREESTIKKYANKFSRLT